MSLVDSSDSKGGRACRVGGRKKIFGTRMFIATIRRSVVDGRRACVGIDVGGVASVGGRCAVVRSTTLAAVCGLGLCVGVARHR